MKLAIEYTAQIWREGDQFIAHTMPLDVASSGASPEEARKALDEAVHLFLSTASEHGTLDQVLEDSGYVQTGHSWQSPSWLSAERGEAVLTV
jgi:predicted RNase H-like HicB family nuclease